MFYMILGAATFVLALVRLLNSRDNKLFPGKSNSGLVLEAIFWAIAIPFSAYYNVIGELIGR